MRLGGERLRGQRGKRKEQKIRDTKAKRYRGELGKKVPQVRKDGQSHSKNNGSSDSIKIHENKGIDRPKDRDICQCGDDL